MRNLRALRCKGIVLTLATASILTLSGCGESIDKNRLAQLTGDKSFDQVKESYKTAVLYDKTDDIEIYKYYLVKNSDKVPGFDFDMYSKKVNQDHQELKSKLEATLAKFRENLDKVPYQTLKNELTMSAFAMGQAKAMDDYAKGIEALIAEKHKRTDAQKAAQKAAEREKMLANETPKQRETREFLESKGIFR